MTDALGEVYSSEDLKGKNLVLIFFSTSRYIKPPYFKINDYKKLVEEFTPQNIVFITIFRENIDEDVQEISKIINTPIVSEGRGFQMRFGNQSGSSDSIIVVDKNSKVYGFAQIAPDLDDLTKILKQIPK
jgi:hypothetical protein